MVDYVAAQAVEKEHRTKLERIAKAKTACENIPMAVPAALIEEETKTEAALRRACAWAARANPAGLQQERRLKASKESLDFRIAAPRPKVVRLGAPENYNVLAPPELKDPIDIVGLEALDDNRTFDPVIRAIRRAFIPDVVRSVFEVVRQVARAVREQHLQRFATRYGCRPSGKDELAQLQRDTSKSLNQMTARIVKAFYPWWADHLTPALVRMTLENNRKRSARSKLSTRRKS